MKHFLGGLTREIFLWLITLTHGMIDPYPSEYLTSIMMKNYSRGRNFSSRALYQAEIDWIEGIKGENRQQVKFSDSSYEAHINKMLRYISNMLHTPLFLFSNSFHFHKRKTWAFTFCVRWMPDFFNVDCSKIVCNNVFNGYFNFTTFTSHP